MKSWLVFVLFCAVAVTAQNPIDRITQAVQAFQDTFQRQSPFNQYISGVQFTSLGNEKIYHNDIVLTHDETWNSWCLDVTIGVNLPENIKELLPSTFWEFKVFYNPATEGSTSEDSEPMMCPMIAFICPDGSTASMTHDCKFVCGSQPIGGLSYEEVLAVKEDFQSAYPNTIYVWIDSLYGRINATLLNPTEQLSDYCLDVALSANTESSPMYPVVYNGVRVFYHINYCAPRICADGSLVGCDSMYGCEEDVSASSGSILVPLAAIIFIVTLSTCCCYLRGRKCRARCAVNNKSIPVATQETQEAYPSEQYELLQHQEQEAFAHMMMPQGMMPMPMMPMPTMMPMMHMSPHLSAHMGLPPMPPVPPSMMMPNGAYPIMMQAPNGMWYPAPMHPEDA